VPGSPSLRAAICRALAVATVLGLLPAAGSAASRPKPLPKGPAPALELEAALAAREAVYVVIDPAAGALEIRARGMTLDRVALTGVAVVRQEHLLGSDEPLSLELPAIWQITLRHGTTAREIITPPALQPYPEDGEPEDRPAAKRVTARAPASYHVLVDSGWAVAFDRELPGSSLFDRLREAVDRGWQRLFDVEIEGPPTLALAMAPEDSERLHHLLRRDTALLVLPPGPGNNGS
jgi:hypothetical protein